MSKRGQCLQIPVHLECELVVEPNLKIPRKCSFCRDEWVCVSNLSLELLHISWHIESRAGSWMYTRLGHPSILNLRRDVGSSSEIEMQSSSSPLRSFIWKSVNLGKMSNIEKDSERESQVLPLIDRFSRTGWWHLNNSGKRRSTLVQSEIDRDFNVVGKPTLYRDLRKLQSEMYR